MKNTIVTLLSVYRIFIFKTLDIILLLCFSRMFAFVVEFCDIGSYFIKDQNTKDGKLDL